MKKSILKQLIQEVISIMEDPDTTKIAGKEYDYEGDAYPIIISNDGKSGFMGTTQGTTHYFIEKRVRAYIASQKSSNPNLKERDIAVSGMSFINDLWWYNVQMFKFDTTQNYFDTIACRIFNHPKFPRVSFWADWDTIDLANIFSGVSALPHLLQKVGIDIKNCTFEDENDSVLTYQQMVNKEYKKEKFTDEEEEIRHKIAGLKQALHTADPIEKKKLRSQIDALLVQLGEKPNDDSDEKSSDWGSDKLAKVASRAGYKIPAEFDAVRSIDETV